MIQILTAVPDGRMIGIDMQMVMQTAIQLLNAIILFAFLFFILYKPVRAFLQKRSDKVQSQLERAAQDMSLADQLKAQYTESLLGIEGERDEILDAAHKSASEKGKDIVEEAKHEAEAARKQAELDILHQQEQVQSALKHHVIELSSAMASKIVSHVMNEATQDLLFAEALRELEDTTWPK